MNANAITQIDQANDLAIINPEPIERNPAAVYLAGLQSAGGKRVQRQALEVIAEMLIGSPDILACNWPALRFQHTQAIRAQLGERYSHTSANRMLSALRGVLKAAFLLGQMPADAYQRAIMVKALTGETVPAGRELGGGELAALMQACENDPSPAGIRDAAIIALMYVGGLRRAEVAGAGNYEPEEGRLVIRGKRNKERTIYLANGAKRAMDEWLALRGDWDGALFCPVAKGGKLQRRKMSAQAIYNMLKKRGDQAGVNSFSPHDLRRTFVSDLLDAGVDISTVAKMAGHANVTTTARYDRRPERAKQKAAGLLHVPYRGRLV